MGTVQAQTDIVNETLRTGAVPAGWSQTDVTFQTSANGYARFESESAILTSPVIDLSGYTNVELTFDIAKYGSGGNGALTVEFSTDGGSTWTAQTFSSPTPTGSTYLTSGPTAITATGSNVRFRFNNAGGVSQKRVRDVVLSGIAASSNTSVDFLATTSNAAEDAGSTDLALVITNPDASNATTVTISASGATGRISGYSTSVTFPAGSATNEPVTVSLDNNTVCDGDEDVTFTITGITGGSGTPAIGVNNTHTLTITDNETPVDPVATAATGVLSNGFTANWNAVNGATGYFLDVSTYPAFGTTTSPGTSTTETFTNIGGGTSSSYLTRTWTGDDGVGWTAYKARTDQVITAGSDAITLRDQSGAYLESDAIADGVTTISFDVQQVFSGSGGELTVRVLSGTGFATSTTIGTIAYTTSVSSFSQVFAPINGPIKIVVENNALARPVIDNLAFTRASTFTPSFVPGYENLSVSGTTQAVTGLAASTIYYYRVRSTGGCSTGDNSNTVSVTTLDLPGCTDPLADNYNASATTDDGSCTYCAPAITYNAPTPTPITIGSGIPDQNMAVAQDCRGIDLALSAFERYVGPIIPTANVYTTTVGHSPTSGTDPTPDPNATRWNILGSIDLGTHDFTQVGVFLDLDFDPGASPVWNTLDVSAQMIANNLGNTHLFQASENLAFTYWPTIFPGVSFDPDVPGIYDVRVRLESTYSNTPLDTLAIRVVVQCAPHAGNVWYVNDASTTGDVYTTAVGDDSGSGTASCPFATIGYAISQASAGDTIMVDAGSYAENLYVDKKLDLRGVQYNNDPNTRTGAESIIHPAVSDPDPYSATASVIMYLADNGADSTKINGFTFDGDNPDLTSGEVQNGADIDAIEAIGSYTGNSGLDIAYNVIKNISYAGLDLDNYTGTGIVNGITVHHNLFDNITSTSWGIGAILQYNAYADITNNTMIRVRIGIQTGNQSVPNVGGNPQISNNTITSYRLGIFHNVQYATASPFQITDNDFLTEAGSPNNTGIFIGTIDPTVTMTLQNNDVTGAQRGIMMWNSNSPSGITVEGGTLTDCGIGVFVNNYDGYPASPNATRPIHAILNNVNITNADTGVYVKDNMLNTHATATLHVDISGNSTINVADGGVNVRVAGAKSSLSFLGSAVDLTGNALRHIRLESNGSTTPATDIDATQVKFNGATATTATGFTIEDLIDHKVDLLDLGEVTFVPGEVFVTVNSFVAPNTAGSVQRGIDVSANGETVHVNDGTYNEDVNVNKAITLQGNDRDLTILRGTYSTTAPALSIGANATVRDLTSTRDYGTTLAEWQSSPKTQGVQFMGNGASMDNVLVTGHRNGVYINNRQNISVTNCVVEDNRTGFQLGNDVSGTTITNNFIQDNFTMGFLFNFDLGGTPNTTGLTVSENSFSGNWYAEVSYQGTPNTPVSGSDFSCNWYGTNSPVVSATATGEPGYATQVPSQFGGTPPGTPPAGQIMGISAALVPYQPFGHSGTDDDAGTPGFQPVPGNCDVVYYSQATGNMSDPIWDVVPVGTASAATFSGTTNVVIQNGHTVTNTGTVDVKSLTVETGGSLALAASSSLTVNGDEAIFDGSLTAADNSELALAGTDATILESTGGPLNLWNLTVNTPQGTLTDATIAIRGTLQLNDGDFDASTGNVTLASDVNGTGRLGPVAATASYTGNLTVQRYIPAGHTNWRLLGSPVNGQTVNNWQDDFFTAGYPGSAYPNFFDPVGSGIFWPSVRWYNETNPFADVDSGLVGVSSNMQALSSGQGFMAWSGDSYSTTQAFTLDLTGTPVIAQAPLTLPMSFTSSGSVEADGWNLVSNPLPSPIAFNQVLRGADVQNAYWIFDPVAGNYKAWTAGVGQGSLNGVIQSSQGFWLKADGAALLTTVNENAKVDEHAGGTFGGSQQPVLPVINLNITSSINPYSDQATLVLDQGTPAYSGNDALKISYKTIGAPQIGIESTDGKLMSVDFYGTYSDAVQIPLLVDADVSGTYTITASMAGITSLSCLTLADLQTGTVTPLADGASYSFTMDADELAQGRFMINGTAPLGLYVENALCHDQNGAGSVVVNGDGPITTQWTDAFGNILLTMTGNDSSVYEFDAPAGNYTVHVSPVGACGEVSADFTITAPPAIETAMTATATSCPNSDDGTAEVTATGGTAPFSFLWNNGATTPGTSGPAGGYSVTVTDANGCTLASNATITAGEGTIAGFQASATTTEVNEPVSFTNSSVLADGYVWDFGDGSTSTETTPTHAWTLPGTYTVTLTASGGNCTDMATVEITVEMTTGIAAAGTAVNLAVWATKDHLIITHAFGNKPVDVDVLDATGRLVLGHTGIVMPERITLDDHKLSTGVWFVRVKSGDTERTFRVPLVR